MDKCRKQTKRLIISILICSFVFVILQWPVLIPAKTQDGVSEDQSMKKEWHALNELAEQALKLIHKQELSAARNVVLQLEETYLSLAVGTYVDRLEQASVLSETIIQARHSLAQVEPNLEQVEANVLKMRLALDAVSHKQTPLWLQYYPTLVQVINELDTSMNSGEREKFYQQLNELNAKYELVRPALFMSHQPGVVEQLDSLFTFLINNRSELWQNERQLTRHIAQLTEQIQFAFFQQTDQSVQSLLWTSLALAVLICTVLTYVAWKKYRGEQYKTRTVGRRAFKNID
jgi:sporulation protein YpjB